MSRLPIIGTLNSCFEYEGRPVWAERPHVYALVIDGGEVECVKSKAGGYWQLLKMTVTDKTHASCIVNFWCDKAQKAKELAARPGDVVCLIRIFEPKKSTEGALDQGSSAQNVNPWRFPRQLSAYDLRIAWRNGCFFNDRISKRGVEACASVVQWAQSTWPALCAALQPNGDSLFAGTTGSSPLLSAASPSFSSFPEGNHRGCPLILPKFYRLKDLIGVGGCCSDSVSGSTTFGSFQGACLLRCRLKRVYLPSRATDLYRALREVTAIEYLGAPRLADMSPPEELVVQFLEQLVNPTPLADGSYHYHGWYLKVTDCDEESLDQTGPKNVPPEEQECLSQYCTQDFIDDLLGDSESSGSPRNDVEADLKLPKKGHPLYRHPSESAAKELDVLVTSLATQELLGGLCAPEARCTEAVSHTRLVEAARGLVALHHEATITAISMNEDEEMQLKPLNTPLWIKLWVEVPTELQRSGEIDARACRFITPNCISLA